MTQRMTERPAAGLRVAIAAAGICLAALAHVTLASAALAQSGGMGMADFESARDSFFSSADRDGDFALSSSEILNAMGSGDAELFDCEDSDGDGLCGYSEFLDTGLALFQQLDKDDDGWLSSMEIQ